MALAITLQLGKEECRAMVPCNLHVHWCMCWVTRTFGIVCLMLMR